MLREGYKGKHRAETPSVKDRISSRIKRALTQTVGLLDQFNAWNDAARVKRLERQKKIDEYLLRCDTALIEATGQKRQPFVNQFAPSMLEALPKREPINHTQFLIEPTEASDEPAIVDACPVPTQRQPFQDDEKIPSKLS